MKTQLSLACLGLAGLAFLLPAPQLAAQTPAPAAPAAAQARPFQLMVGDKAPALSVKKFVKGEPVTEFKSGQVYVVEFWATWCGPCKQTIPHLTELQKRYGSKVRFIGVSVWEDDQGLVEPFVTEWADKMDYTVAMDDVAEGDKRGSNGKMSVNWMKAAGRNGIPSAFIVDGNGKVAWIDHPMSGLDKTLDELLAGKFDLASATRDYSRSKEAEAKMQPLRGELGKAMRAGDGKAALAALDKMIELDPSSEKNLCMTKVQVLLNVAKDYEAGYAYAGKLVDGMLKDNANGLNAIAWMIVDPDAKNERPDLKLALRAAQRGNELMKPGEPMKASVLDTLARVHFAMGDLAKAREIQEQAIEAAPAEQKDQLRGTLEEYRKATEKH